MQATNKSSRRQKRFSQNKSEELTAFQRRVYEQVKKIPKNRVATYGQIACMLGKPACARAVGNALNKNIFSDVACHRVVRADGAIGGYAWGRDKKIDILRRERVRIKNGYVDLSLYNITHPISSPKIGEARSEV